MFKQKPKRFTWYEKQVKTVMKTLKKKKNEKSRKNTEKNI